MIASFNFTASTLYYPYYLLGSQPNIAEVLKRYRYFRAGVRLRVQLVAPPSTLGTVVVCPLYNYTAPEFALEGFNSTAALSSPNCMILDVSRREGVEFVMPYVYPFEYIDLETPDDPATRWPYNAIQISVPVLNSVDASIANPVVNIQVWASFVDIQVAAPISMAQGEMDTHSAIRSMFNWGLTTGASVVQKNVVDPALKKVTERVEQTVKDYVGGEDGEAAPMRFSPYGALSAPTYDNRSQHLGGARLNSLPKVPVEGETGDFDLYEMTKIPTYISQSTLVVGTPDSNYLYPLTAATGGNRGWPQYVLYMFRMYRGSIKVHLRFVTSTLVTARAVVFVTWGDPSLTVLQQNGDVYTQVVSIQGTTDVTFTVPFVSDQHWFYSRPLTSNSDAIGNPYGIPCVVAYLQAATTAVGTDSPVVLQTWVSMADDLVMRYPQSLFYMAPAEAEGQMNLTVLHKDQAAFPSITGKYTAVVDDRDISTMREYLNRYCTAGKGLFPALPDYSPVYGVNFSNFDAIIRRMCRFVSGGIRYKVEMAGGDIVFPNSNTIFGSTSTVDIPFDLADGVTKAYTGVWGILEFEVPYSAPLNMYPTGLPTNNDANARCEHVTLDLAARFPSYFARPEDVEFACKAAGSDYQLHVLNWPPGATHFPPYPITI